MQGRLRNDGWEMRKAEEAGAVGIDRESTWKGTCNYWKYYCKEFEIELRIPGLAVSCFRKESYNSLSGCAFLSPTPDVAIWKLRLLLHSLL